LHVLLVEDEDLNVELFHDILTDEGHDVVVERDGPSGRARGLAEAFDLVLLDLHLPGIGGPEVCRDLRAAGVRAPIIAISASAMPDEIARAMPAGFNEYLTKPITPAALRAAIARHASAARPRGLP
jgi:CheY-like chemotaxis protein